MFMAGEQAIQFLINVYHLLFKRRWLYIILDPS